ncbi:hypothetical protein KKB18_13710, partial [bacterium]|nr:hypothetical protein [bacterium]
MKGTTFKITIIILMACLGGFIYAQESNYTESEMELNNLNHFERFKIIDIMINNSDKKSENETRSEERRVG